MDAAVLQSDKHILNFFLLHLWKFESEGNVKTGSSFQMIKEKLVWIEENKIYFKVFLWEAGVFWGFFVSVAYLQIYFCITIILFLHFLPLKPSFFWIATPFSLICRFSRLSHRCWSRWVVDFCHGFLFRRDPKTGGEKTSSNLDP